MSKHNLLLEVGLEEMPARFVSDARFQLEQKITEWLKQQRIAFDGAKAFATPRRLAVLVTGVAEKQADSDEVMKGPSKKAGIDENGQFTKAALGFARGQGVAPEALFVQELNGVDYLFARKHTAGIETEQLLGESLAALIAGMNFPKNMRWKHYDLRFIRPIRWLVALYGEKVVPLELAGVISGRETRGHRFLGGPIMLTEASGYEKALEAEWVIADPDKRKAMIRTQLAQLVEEKGWVIGRDEELLEEITYLVEYPTVLYGAFDPAFLDIPKEVLITSMREHQRYFPVMDQEGKLLPFFLTVRNGDDRSLEIVAKGNEKVLRARLSDARFFYQEDQKLKIDNCLKRLEQIVFHEQLGTIADKVRRVGMIVEAISGRLELPPEEKAEAERAGAIAKFDLVTQMVYEFPELQGVMGRDYAAKAGESAAVAEAIYEHYLPRFSGDALPQSRIGQILSVADKLDTIVGCFGIGIIPTGSQDPYALRRQAMGIVQILIRQKWPLALETLINMSLDCYEKQGVLTRSRNEILDDLYDFFNLRLKAILQEEQVRYDVIDALLAERVEKPYTVIARAKVLMDALSLDSFKTTVEAFNRVNNLAAKAEDENAAIAPELFEHEAERELYREYREATTQFTEAWEQEDYQTALNVLAQLKPAIDHYFDAIMVMAEDERLRRNRLQQLASLSRCFKRFADFTKLVFF
jgi:glycyl-tRNA synthetase beta chain